MNTIERDRYTSGPLTLEEDSLPLFAICEHGYAALGGFGDAKKGYNQRNTEAHANTCRAIECWNACLGIENPQEALKAAKEALDRAQVLLRLVTIRQVINAGDRAMEASGLNPYCLNEGAPGDDTISPHFIERALNQLNGK